MIFLFLMDENVDTAADGSVRGLGFDVERAVQVGLTTANEAQDDDLSVWAQEHGAIVVSHDIQLGQRRLDRCVGRHVWLDCRNWDAAATLVAHMDRILAEVGPHRDVTVKVSQAGIVRRSIEAWD